MENLESPKTVAESRIPKAPAIVPTTMAKAAKLQSPVGETKLPMIKSPTKCPKQQTTTASPTSNQMNSSTPPTLGTGTKLRRAKSSLTDSNIAKANAPTGETKLRRTKSTLTETKRPKSQILMSGTKLPKLQPNASEAKTSKGLTVKLPQLGVSADAATRETKGRKIPKTPTADSKLPRIPHLNLPLKEINSDAAAIERCKGPRKKSQNLEALDLSTELAEPEKTHATSLPPKVSKTTETDTSKTRGAEAKAKTKATHPKASTPGGTAKKLPKKALPVTNTLPKPAKVPSTNAETSSTKNQTTTPTTATTDAGRKLPKAQLSLTGLKSAKTMESKLPKTPTTPDGSKLPGLKLPKTPTTPDGSKLPRLPGAGVTPNPDAETRRQKPLIRR